MNIIDVVIVLLIALAGVVGLKRGFFKQVVMTIGTVLVFILAFYLKNPLADFFCSVLPFFDFFGSFQGIVVLNVILYQLLAFLIVIALLMAVLNIIVSITGLFEKVLKFTIILGIPSKILGFIVGLIEGYIVMFVILFFLNQPAVNIDIINQSKLMPKILNHTPGLTNIVSDMNETITDIYHLKDQFGDGKNPNQFNLETLDVMLEHGIIKPSSVEKLIENGKLDGVSGIDSVLNKYR